MLHVFPIQHSMLDVRSSMFIFSILSRSYSVFRQGSPRPERRHAQAGDDMPDTPPCGNNGHTTQTLKKAEYQNQTQCRVLNAHLDGHSTYIPCLQTQQPAGPVPQAQSQGIMDEDPKDNEANNLEKDLPVGAKCRADKTDEDQK